MTLNLGMHHRVLEYYQVCSNDDPALTLTFFTARSNLVPYAFVWEKGKRMDFFSETFVVYDLKLATDDRSDKKFLLSFCWHQNVVPCGLSVPAPGLYTCIKSWQKLYKIDFKDRFWNLQQMNEVTRHFCWHQTFVPWGLSAIALVLYTCIKLYKVRLQRDIFETCNKWRKWQDVPVNIKISSTRGCQPLPQGYTYACIKSWKKNV